MIRALINRRVKIINKKSKRGNILVINYYLILL